MVKIAACIRFNAGVDADNTGRGCRNDADSGSAFFGMFGGGLFRAIIWSKIINFKINDREEPRPIKKTH